MVDVSGETGRAIAYTDGSCLGNPGPGGWAVHAELPDGTVVELGGADLHTTNNRMELRAAIEAARLTAAWPAVTIVTDSQYVRRGITEWIAGWKRKGWKTVTGKPVENQALWEELDALADRRITWAWTRGHSGDPGNERCDAICRWFAEGIRPLSGRGTARPTRAGGASTAAPDVGARDRPAAAAGLTSRSAGGGTPGVSYLSLVDGILQRHRTWGECERRVRGVRAARYRKVTGPEQEAEVLRGWGLTAGDLFGVE